MSAGVLLGSLVLGLVLGCGSDSAAAAQRSEPRRAQLLSAGWRFLDGDLAGAEAPELDDASWSPVSVPHTWNALDGQDGGGDYRRGAGWYRLRLPELEPGAGERVYLQFEGANAVADVYLNGTHLGQHRGGYSRFRFDATSALRRGANLLAVRVDNSALPDVPPLQADYTFFGGLYRDVQLLRVQDLHLDLDDAGAPGVYLTTSNVSAAGADLSARVRVSNAGAQERELDVTLSVLDAEGAALTVLSGAVTPGAGETRELVLSGHVDSPQLWQGRTSPYLYRAVVELRSGGAVTDRLEQPLGFRALRLDPALGFFLNEEPLDLHGVNRHQDHLDRGWAIGTAEHEQDMQLIAELGATAVRLAHYQQADYAYELCDRLGLVVWAEIPLVDAVTDSPAFSDNARQQLRELILQNYNHPSIAFWGIGNEQRTSDAATNELLGSLAELVREQDPGRISTYAHCCGDATGPLVSHADATGYNLYYGWYMGSAAQSGEAMDFLHAARPDAAIALSEYGAGASLSQHEAAPRQPVAASQWHPEEYQTQLHELTWPQLAVRRYLWGKFIWNMFDFASDGRDEGDTPGRNDKGLVSYDRATRKDAFYWYQANWSAEPMLHIAGRRLPLGNAESVDIKVYSNQSEVRLRVNGDELAPAAVDGHIARWNGVPLLPGENRVEAFLPGGAAPADSVVWVRE